MDQSNDDSLGPSPLQGIVNQALQDALIESMLRQADRRFFQAGAIKPEFMEPQISDAEREQALAMVRGLMRGYEPLEMIRVPIGPREEPIYPCDDVFRVNLKVDLSPPPPKSINMGVVIT